MTVSTHSTGLPDVTRQTAEYHIEVLEKNQDWGAMFLRIWNHPDFSYRQQDLTLAVRGGGFKGKLRDIEVYMWLSNDEWSLEGEALIDRLKEILI